MSYRPYNYSRRDQDQRHDFWSPSYKKTMDFKRFQAKNPGKFFTKTWVCKKEPHIKLFCPLCPTHCVEFGDYVKHLASEKHSRAMDKRIVTIEKEIENKRKEQADVQAAVDGAAKMEPTYSSVLNYCAVCNLNYCEEESNHIASRLHVALQKLLEPICNICPYQAKDPVDYENHICSLKHVMREESWTSENTEHCDQSVEEVPNSYERKTEEASTSSRNDPFQPFRSCEAMTVQSGTEASVAHSKNSTNPSDAQKEDFEDAFYCRRCNVYGMKSAKWKHCQTKQHLELWVKHVEGISKGYSKK